LRIFVRYTKVNFFFFQVIQNAIANALNNNVSPSKSNPMQTNNKVADTNNFLAELRSVEDNCFCADCGAKGE
jgi:hypothetical protein